MQQNENCCLFDLILTEQWGRSVYDFKWERGTITGSSPGVSPWFLTCIANRYGKAALLKAIQADMNFYTPQTSPFCSGFKHLLATVTSPQYNIKS